jgi:hypothetical protein
MLDGAVTSEQVEETKAAIISAGYYASTVSDTIGTVMSAINLIT